PSKRGSIDRKRAVAMVNQLSRQYGLNVDPEARVRDISVGMQQRVEILKTLYRGAEILIMDEPTAVLTPQEVEELIEILKTLIEEGKSIIFITHKLKEAKMISDRVTVIRSGKLIDTVDTNQATTSDLARMMVGREVLLNVEKEEAEPGEVILKVDNLHARNDRNLPALRGCSFNLRKGEILGLAGVEGNGQSELAEVLTGLRELEQGEIIFKDEKVNQLTTRQLLERGISHIPEDRQRRGLIMDYKLSENFILGNHYHPPYARGFNLNQKYINQEARDLIAEFDVRTPSENVLARSLSGGNQQKVILAREFNRDPDLLIASQPTRGVDVGAIEFIRNRLIEQRDKGKAVLLISLELDEILAMSDRIAVIYEGEIVDIMDQKQATEEKLGLMMAGAHIRESGVDKEGVPYED
ncbi:MAG: ABC transporter ATP-binding protein, partial [Bacillota bacterium]